MDGVGLVDVGGAFRNSQWYRKAGAAAGSPSYEEQFGVGTGGYITMRSTSTVAA